MRKHGLSEDDANSYASTRSKTTQLSDDQRTIFNSQLSAFRGNQIVKDYEQQAGQLKNAISSLSAESGP